MLNNRNIIAALITALACFVFIAVILPEYDTIQADRVLLKERQDRLAERTELVNKVAELNRQYKQNTNDISKLDILLPTNKQQDQILSSIQAIVSQAGLILAEVNTSDVQGQSDVGYKSILISIRTTGQYQQLFDFMRLLEQSLRLYDIQSIGITEASSGSSTGGNKPLSFEIKIHTNSIK